MHGIGNDYLYFFEEPPADVEELAVKLSDRNRSLGSDGLIYMMPSETADYRMRIFNADGSEAMMCGNGIRCVGRYLYDRGITDKTSLRIETNSGIRELTLHVKDGCAEQVTVNMGTAEVSEACSLTVGGKEINLIPVSVGNPHAVMFTGEEGLLLPEQIGALIEHHPQFPGGVNAEFVQVISEQCLRMRVWERGSGVTKACGTGACASAAAAVEYGLCMRNQPITLELDGGLLEITVDDANTVYMKGPAEFAYEAEVTLQEDR